MEKPIRLYQADAPFLGLSMVELGNNRIMVKKDISYFWISFLLFVLCLTQDAYYTDGGNPSAWPPGWELFLYGWLGLLGGIFAWLANPALIIAWVMLRKKQYEKAMICSVIALLFSVSFLFHETVLSDATGRRDTVTGYGYAYWLWLLSQAVVLYGSWRKYSDTKAVISEEAHSEQPEG
tara:strand:+ start:20739 stop:21275 length:537 start_codon:yes stop_codon:yes gene_type:complete